MARPRKRVPAWRSVNQHVTLPGQAGEFVLWQHTDGRSVLMPPAVHPDAAGGVSGDAAVDDTEETAVDRLQEVLLKGRDQDKARVKLSEILEDGSLAVCREYTPDEFEQGGVEMIRRKWGPGKYRVELYAHNPENGRFSRYGRAEIIVKPEREPDRSEAASGQLAAVLDRIEKAITTPKDPMANFREMLGLAALMREAFGLKAGGGGGALQAPNFIQQMTDFFAAARGFKEFTEELGAEKSADPLMTLAPKALDIVQSALSQRPAPPALAPVHLPPTLAPPGGTPDGAGAPPTVAPSSAAPAPAPPAAPSEESETVTPTEEFAHLVKTYVGLAMMKADTQRCADMIFETAGDDLEAFLKRGDWFELMAGAYSAASSYRAWFTEVRDHVLRLFAEERALGPDTNGSGDVIAGKGRAAPLPKGKGKKAVL